MSLLARFYYLVVLGGVIGCGEGQSAANDTTLSDSVALARQDSINRAHPGYIVDSILPIEEQLRRFRAGFTDTLRNFEGGATSREELVRKFVQGLEASDTAALVRLTISRAEFAWLVYPDSPLSAPLYRQAPDLVWLRHTAASAVGLTRLLERLGGSRLGVQSWNCADAPNTEGSNRIWQDCAVRFHRDGTGQRTMRLFSGIIERQRRFKILSYANGF
jgi:hypothetical protein